MSDAFTIGQTIISRDSDGLTARTRVTLTTTPLAGGGHRILEMMTTKDLRGRLYSSVQAAVLSPDGSFEFVMSQDYRQTLETTNPPRVTAKVIDAQHARALARVPELVAEVEAFYAPKSLEDRVNSKIRGVAEALWPR